MIVYLDLRYLKRGMMTRENNLANETTSRLQDKDDLMAPSSGKDDNFEGNIHPIGWNKSCVSCSSSKRKCDGLHPCSRCHIGLLIADTMSTFQTNAGNIILTLSKLHIRAIHHTLSEIGTKRGFSYQGSAIERNYKGQKSLVEANGKHGFDLKTLISIFNYSSSFYGDSRALPISPLVNTDPF